MLPTPGGKVPVPDQARSHLTSRMILDRLLSFIVLLWVVVIASVFLASYLSTAWTDALSAAVVDGWCDPTTDGVGSHCFGDFGVPYYLGGSEGGFGYTPGNVNATNTPLVVLIFDVANALPYRLILALNILGYLAGMAALLLLSSRQLDLLRRSLVVVFGGLLSVGLLAAIDRGNHVAFIAPLVGLLIMGRQPWVRILAMTLLFSIKFWGFIFVLVLLRRRLYKEALVSGVLALSINLAALTLTSPSLFEGARSLLEMTTSRDFAKQLIPFSITLMGLIRKASCVGGPEFLCPVSGDSGDGLAIGVSVLIFLGLLALSWAAMSKREWSPFVRYAPLVSVVILGLPEAGMYVLVLVPVLTALLAKSASTGGDCGAEPWWLRSSLVATIALGTAPIGLWWSLPEVHQAAFIRWQYIVAPVTWSVCVGLTLWALWIQRRRVPEPHAPYGT